MTISCEDFEEMKFYDDINLFLEQIIAAQVRKGRTQYQGKYDLKDM